MGNSCLNNKLFHIKPNIREWLLGYRKLRKEVALVKFYIGHNSIIGLYILKMSPHLPKCVWHLERYAVKYILTEYVDFIQACVKYYRTTKIKELSDEPGSILQFLRGWVLKKYSFEIYTHTILINIYTKKN